MFYVQLVLLFSLGETVTNAALAAINPTKKIPALDDNGFTMFERYFLNHQS